MITSITAFELLGSEYRYQTNVTYSGKLANGIIDGNVYVEGVGDPTLGSWRFKTTKDQVLLDNWTNALTNGNIKEISGQVIANNSRWESQTVPGGWIWEDIGNYYGAGASAINWHENQYDIDLASGKQAGDEVSIVSTSPPLFEVELKNELLTGAPGSGDNAYIYLAPYSHHGFVRGTIPPNQKSFIISGSFPDPPLQLATTFTSELQKHGIKINSLPSSAANGDEDLRTTLFQHTSPPLDSINDFFLKKSINLYGESLVKTIAFEKYKFGSTEAGLQIIKDFWAARGIEPATLNIVDGSGLSPQNRVTAKTLVSVMQYARSRSWFASFYAALPTYNNIKMKSGTIGGVKSFTGYLNNYTFAIVINNYNGSSKEIVQKIYHLLDLLK